MAVSIKDIARKAGVSHSTVSRALHNSPLIPEETAARIQQIARDMGYAASAVARSLVRRKTEVIGVVVTTIADPFNGEVVAGMEAMANEHGYSVMLANSQADPDREIAVVRSFQERRVDGVLVASSRVGALYIPLLTELQIPIVLLNNQHPGEFVHSLTIDNFDGAYKATRHLIELGHKRVAYLGDRLGLQSNTERCRGYRKAMREAGLRIRPEWVVEGDGRPEGGEKQAAALLALAETPTAIVCYNDMTALGAMEAAKLRGLSVPSDLSLTGFDDLFFSSLLRPPLTTIRQPKYDMGRRSMEMLLRILRSEETERTETIRGELIIRGSSGDWMPPDARAQTTSRSYPGKTPIPNPRNKA